MITPVGKFREQKKQANYKNGVFLEHLFKDSALPLGAEDAQGAPELDPKKKLNSNPGANPMPSEQPVTPENPAANPDLQNAMNDSSNPAMNVGNKPAGNGQEQLGPNSGNQDFATISGEFSKFLGGSEKLQGKYVIVSQAHDQRKGSFTFVIEPAQQPELSGQPSQILVQK